MRVTRRDLLKAGTALPFAGTVLGASPPGPQSFTTIQAALDDAQPGDTVEVPAGTYHETIVFPRSGTPDAPITLTSAPGARVIIDGADPGLQTPSSGVWTPVEGGGFRATVPFDGANLQRAIATWVSRYRTPGTNDCDQLIAAYASLAALQGVDPPRGEGSFRSADNVYVRLADEMDPNTVGLSIGRSEAVVHLDGRSHIGIRNIEIRNAGWAGIVLGNADRPEPTDIKLEDLTIRNCFRGITGGGGAVAASDVTIRQVRILNGKIPAWPRGGGYAAGVGQHPSSRNDGLAPWRGHGIVFPGRNVEVVDCLVSGQWDAVKVAGSENVRIHHCTMRNIWDDAVELESTFQHNIEVFNNHMYDINSAVSIGYNTPGPVYIYRNVAEGTTEAIADGGRGGSPYSIKSGEGPAGAIAENVKIYHNTFFASRAYNIWKKLDLTARFPDPDRWHGYEFVNNIFYRLPEINANFNFRGVGPGVPGEDNYWEANVYNVSTPEDQLGLDWDEGELNNANAPWLAHDLNNVPEHVGLLGSFAVPAAGGAESGTEYSVSTAALAGYLDQIRTSGARSATFILRESERQVAPVHFASKEGTLPPTSLSVGMEAGHEVSFDRPAADTYVVHLAPNTPRGSEDVLVVQYGPFSINRQLGYVRFDLADLLSEPVESATLTVRLASIGSDRTASTIEVYGLGPGFTPSLGAEKDSLTFPDLADHFRRFEVDSPTTPRDLRLKSSSPAARSASDYPTQQGWPDSVRRDPHRRHRRNRGAWEHDMRPDDIGAPASVINQGN